jgi:uncharacterized membrane protein YagU involved in acid resistance
MTRKSDLLNGALAGVIGAACMTPVRLTARRLGLVEKTTPQMIEEALAARLGLGHDRDPEVHHVLDHALHLAFGATLGVLYALPTRRRRSRPTRAGLLFGAVSWLFGAGVVVPAIRAHRPFWRAAPVENLVNLAAHVVFGLTTALVVEELSGQTDHGPTSFARRAPQRVG